MKRRAQITFPQLFTLAAGIMYASALLRLLLNFGDTSASGRLFGLLLIWLSVFLSQPALTRRWPGYLSVYLMVQAGLVFGMLFLGAASGVDYLAVLLAVLCMQAMQHLEPQRAALWLALFLLPMAGLFLVAYDFIQGLSFALLYSAVSLLLAAYSLAARRAQAAHVRNQALADDLQAANRQLQDTSAQLERLATARERSRLRRELHDAVTQTVFSMNLTAQSAALLLRKDPGRVAEQLERLDRLAQSALAELKLLAPQFPDMAESGEVGLVDAIRRHVAGPSVAPTLQVTLDVQGRARLGPAEAHGLYRIAQEALNNIIKHAGTDQAAIQLHLEPPCWMQVEDHGRGFDLAEQPHRGVGLAGMRARAAEIGWELQINSTPGGGTCVWVGKPMTGEEQGHDGSVGD